MKSATESAKVIPFRKKKNHKRLVSVLGLGILVVFVALFTPWFNIKTIEVTGNSRINQEDIINLSEIPIGQNIFRVNYFRAKDNIKKNSYIQSVKITRSYPNKVVVNVEERKRAGYIQVSGKYLIVDKNAVVLETATDPKAIGAPNVWGLSFKTYELGKVLKPNDADKDKFELLLSCFSEISASGLSEKLSKIDVGDPGNIVIWVYNDKYQIKIGDSKGFDYKLKFAQNIIEKQEKAKGPSGTISFTNEHKAVFVPR